MGERRGGAPSNSLLGRTRDSRKAVNLFARQMATLLGAGLPVVRSLETLIRQETEKHFRGRLRVLAGEVRGGASLSRAMSAHPHIFDHLLLSMVRAGETSGDLPGVLRRVAKFREKSARIKGRVQAAMVYPVIVIGVAACIVSLLLAFVVPRFQSIFQDMLRGQPLPLLTQAVIDVSSLVRDHWIVFGIGALLLWVCLPLVARTGAGRRYLDTVLFHCPGCRAVVRRTAIARFTRTFGTLLRAGVPMLEALCIGREVAGNAVVQRAVESIHDRVRDGSSIAAPMEASNAFPPMVASLIGVGEETGQLPEMCDRLADAYEEELENVVAAMTSIVEPVMIVLLALVVGTLVIALFLPIVSIIQNLTP